MTFEEFVDKNLDFSNDGTKFKFRTIEHVKTPRGWTTDIEAIQREFSTRTRDDVSLDEIQRVLNDRQEKNKKKSPDYRKLITEWLAANDYSALPQGIYVSSRKHVYEVDDIATMILEDYHANNVALDHRRIIQALNLKRTEDHNTRLDEVRERLRFNEQYREISEEFVRRLYNGWKIEGEFNEFRSCFLHFAWLVKLKTFAVGAEDLRERLSNGSERELWLNFLGAQHVGKNVFIEAFRKPLMGFSAPTTISEIIAHEKNFYLLNENSLVVINELAVPTDSGHASKTISADLRRLTSEFELESRKYHTQSRMKKLLRANFLSSSNESIYSLLRDPTGMRRYYEFVIGLPADVVMDHENWSWIESHVEQFWKGVDETEARGYLLQGPLLDGIRNRQNRMTLLCGTLGDWIDMGLHPVESNGKALHAAYREYVRTCKTCELGRPVTEVNFKKALWKIFPNHPTQFETPCVEAFFNGEISDEP